MHNMVELIFYSDVISFAWTLLEGPHLILSAELLKSVDILLLFPDLLLRVTDAAVLGVESRREQKKISQL
jgi:hypothetical protein